MSFATPARRRRKHCSLSYTGRDPLRLLLIPRGPLFLNHELRECSSGAHRRGQRLRRHAAAIDGTRGRAAREQKLDDGGAVEHGGHHQRVLPSALAPAMLAPCASSSFAISRYPLYAAPASGARPWCWGHSDPLPLRAAPCRSPGAQQHEPAAFRAASGDSARNAYGLTVAPLSCATPARVVWAAFRPSMKSLSE